MRTIFKELRTKYWDGNPWINRGTRVDIYNVRRPWPRRFWLRHQEHIIKGMWTMVFAVATALAIKVVT